MNSFTRVKWIIIDSGVLYSLTTIPVLITEVLQDSVLHITTAMDVMVIGIAFNLILIRVGKLRKEETLMKQNPALTTIQFASSNLQSSSESSKSETSYNLGSHRDKLNEIESKRT